MKGSWEELGLQRKFKNIIIKTIHKAALRISNKAIMEIWWSNIQQLQPKVKGCASTSQVLLSQEGIYGWLTRRLVDSRLRWIKIGPSQELQTELQGLVMVQLLEVAVAGRLLDHLMFQIRATMLHQVESLHRSIQMMLATSCIPIRLIHPLLNRIWLQELSKEELQAHTALSNQGLTLWYPKDR